MKKITLLSFLLIGSIGFSQINPIDFEVGGNGADWNFTVFANLSAPPIEIIANPDMSGVNTSATVAKFTTLVGGEEYAGAFSDDIGTFTLDATNSTVKMKVWKSVISDVALKFEGNGAIGELKVANTVTEQWEELVFDFSSFIGLTSATGLTKIVIFPDFAARTQDNITYFDSITFSAILGVGEFQSANFSAYPNPAIDVWNLKSQSALITSVELIDVQGKRVLYVQPNNLETAIDASQFSKGIYIARISSEKGVETLKLVKQ